MTTFAAMQSLVIEQTRRPEITGVTAAAIRTATLRAHHVDYFPRDLAVSQLPYTPVSSAQFYDFATISSTLARLRALQRLQGVDSVTYAPAENLEYRELADLYDNDNSLRTSMYTLIGDTLRVYPAAATGALTAYYYQNPVTDSNNYSSWIADTYPDELAMWAAAIVFARTGFAEQAAEFQKNHVQPFKEMLLAAHLIIVVN